MFSVYGGSREIGSHFAKAKSSFGNCILDAVPFYVVNPSAATGLQKQNNYTEVM